ncbi:hypothetical protein BAE44_0021084 [Dichanthelium oligosanthes]|uniref:Uncharacterized protein n=1 Tax=Dichanthelium oligosanthes TaxID=888268 RepID=A0A1E5UYH1_9POAL|nr:hypothetical protein BAE44_0021084 [Dichanthelium oligosanthes]
MWTLFERRIQPLKAHEHPMFKYVGAANPTRESATELTPSEVKAWVRLVLKKALDVEADLDIFEAGLPDHPLSRSLAHNPRHVSLLAPCVFHWSMSIPDLLSYPNSCLFIKASAQTSTILTSRRMGRGRRPIGPRGSGSRSARR